MKRTFVYRFCRQGEPDRLLPIQAWTLTQADALATIMAADMGAQFSGPVEGSATEGRVKHSAFESEDGK